MDTYRPATDRQVEFLRKLLTERSGVEAAEAIRDELNEITQETRCRVSKSVASSAIDRLLKIPAPKAPVASAPAPAIEEGIYFRGAGDDLRIVKVQRAVHGSGNLYAKELDLESGQFEFVSGLVRQLAGFAPLTYEQALEFGQLYGRCMVCGRTLTNEGSIEAGIGPVCGGRLRDRVSAPAAEANLTAVERLLEEADDGLRHGEINAAYKELERAGRVYLDHGTLKFTIAGARELLTAGLKHEKYADDGWAEVPAEAPQTEQPTDTRGELFRAASSATNPSELPAEFVQLALAGVAK